MAISPAGFLHRNAWRLGLGLLAAGLLTARGANQPLELAPHALVAVASDGPTLIQCGLIPASSGNDAIWSAAHSPYILPANDPNLPTDDAAHPNCLKPDPSGSGKMVPDDVYVSPTMRLVIDASLGPVQVFSHGAGITVDGGQIIGLGSASTDAQNDLILNTITFDAEPDVAAWDGIKITSVTESSGTVDRGHGSFAYTSIQHALTAIQIDSGWIGTPTAPDYGLTVTNSGIGPSYFDGIDAVNTPVQVLGIGDGRFGTLNNIGSQGIKVSFDPGVTLPPPLRPLDIEGVTFGSSVPFAETSCVPLQPCAAGAIGNDAIQANLNAAQSSIKLTNNRFYRAGSYGLELNGANYPTIVSNTFVCNGNGSPTPVVSCAGSGLKYSAIYLNNAAAGAKADMVSGISGNKGQQNGLDAIVLNGTVTSNLVWKTPTNDPLSTTAPHDLGYMVANGDLIVSGATLTVHAADVVKLKGGAVVLANATLDARAKDAAGNASTSPKTFTSMRDNSVGVKACPSVFVQSCPLPVPSNEWTGINLQAGSNASIDDARIDYSTTGVQAINGARTTLDLTYGSSFGLVISNSQIGPSFADGVSTLDTPVALISDSFSCPAGACSGPSSGNHGVLADFGGSVGAIGGGLKVTGNNLFQGSVNEAIKGVSLAGQTVDIEGASIDRAGAYGIQLQGADSLTLVGNTITNSGKAMAANATNFPAIYLNGVTNANFVTGTYPASPCAAPCIGSNAGAGNGMDAIAFHGSTATALHWITAGNIDLSAVPTPAPALLGYVLDDALTVKGDLVLKPGDYMPVLRGAVTLQAGRLLSDSAVVTSLREQVNSLPSCGTIFVPAVAGACPIVPQASDYWGGFSLDPAFVSRLNGSSIRYGAVALQVRPTSAILTAPNLVLTDTSIRNISGDGIQTKSPLSVSGGAFSTIGQNGIEQDMGGAPLSTPAGIAALSIGQSAAGRTSFTGIGLAAINGKGLDRFAVSVRDTAIDSAGTYGIVLQSAPAPGSGGSVVVTGNKVTGSGLPDSGSGKPRYPAIYVDGFSGPGENLAGNSGGGNGMNAFGFHGTVTDDLLWSTARQSAAVTALGFVLDGDLDMQNHQLTVLPADIVKSSGSIKLRGRLQAGDTSAQGQKTFTSLSDDAVGVPACGSALLRGCSAAAPGDWGGITLTGSGAIASLVDGAIRYANTGIAVSGGATSNSDSSSFGVTISRTLFGPTRLDAVDASGTPISVTDSTFVNDPLNSVAGAAQHGIVIDDSGDSTAGQVRLTGNRFVNTQAEAILGQQLAGHPVWIADNHVENAVTFAIRLLNSDELVLRNNSIACSGLGAVGTAAVLCGAASVNPYPAIYLNGLTGDFASNIRGNTGRGNGIDGIVFDGTVNRDLNWVNPTNDPAPHPLGYLLDGSLTLQNSNLTVNPKDVVKVLNGSITVNGGILSVGAGSVADREVFTSFRDNSLAAGPRVCPSVFVSFCTAPSAGDWGGITINRPNPGGGPSLSVINNADIKYADTAIAIDAGPFSAGDTAAAGNFRLKVSGTTIKNVSKDGINSLDTPIWVDSSTIGDPATTTTNVGGHGVIASFLSPANCAPSPPAPTCERLELTGNHVYWTGKDGIVANGLGGQPVNATHNTVSHAGTYGIRLVGADRLTLSQNDVSSSGLSVSGSTTYPAIYLPGVTGNFQTDITGNTGASNGLNGLNALVIHGISSGDLTWTSPTNTGALGYMLDGALTVNGSLTADGSPSSLAYVKVLAGAITVNGGFSSAYTVFTSMQDAQGPGSCSTVFVPVACPPGPPPPSGYWGGISVVGPNPAPSVVTLTGDTFTAVNGNGLTLQNASATLAQDTFTHVTGTAVANAGPGLLSIDCSSIRTSGTGVNATGHDSITQSDVYGNTTNLVATPNVTADYDWFGTTPQPGATHQLATQQPTATLNPVSVNPLANVVPPPPAFGIGNMTVTAAFSRKMADTPLPPAIFGLKSDGTFPNSLTSSGFSNNRMTWTYDPYLLDLAHAKAGLNTLRLEGARSCVPPEVESLDSNLMGRVDKDFIAAIKPTALIANPAEGPYGGTVNLTALLTDASSNGLAGEPINFTMHGTSLGPATTAGSPPVGLATLADASLAGIPAGLYSGLNGVNVSFAGDATNFYSPTPAAGAGAITGTLKVDPADTTTALTAGSPNPSTYNQSVSWTATVTTNVVSGVNPNAEGSVKFSDGASVICNQPIAVANSVTCSYSVLGAGGHTITASYVPSTNFNASTSSAVTQTVNKLTPTVTTTPSGGGGAGTFINESITVSGGPSPGGSAVFKLYASSDPTCAGTNLLAPSTPVTVTGGAATSPSYQATVAGTYHWIVNYNGDANLNAVPGSCGDPVVITSDLVTNTQLASGPTNPATSLSSVSLTATVTPTWVSQPAPQAGTVAFTAAGTTIVCGAGSTTGLALTSSSNSVTCVTDYTTVNGKDVEATYTGGTSGGNTYDSSSTTLASSTTTLSSDHPSGIASGGGLVLSATLAPTAAGGTVEFFDGTTPITGCTSQTVTSGVATCTLLISPSGPHSLTAIYSGSTAYETSEGTLTQSVTP